MNIAIFFSFIFFCSTAQAGIVSSARSAFDNYKAWQASRHGDYAAAQQLYEKMLVDYPHDSQINYNLGTAYHHLGNEQRAYDSFERAAQSSSGSLQEQSYFNWANSAVSLQKLDEAVNHYQKVLALNPSNEKASHNLDVVKKMLEDQKKQEQENQQQNNKQDKNQKKNNKNNNNKQSDQNNDKQHNDDKSQSDQSDSNNTSKSSDNEKSSDASQKDQQKGDNKNQQQNKDPHNNNQKRNDNQQDQTQEQDHNNESNGDDNNQSDDDHNEQGQESSDQSGKQQSGDEHKSENNGQHREQQLSDQQPGDQKGKENEAGLQQAQLSDTYDKQSGNEKLTKQMQTILAQAEKNDEEHYKKMIKAHVKREMPAQFGQKNW